MNENYLLHNETAKKLYFEYVKDLPIITLCSQNKPSDKIYNNITEAFLSNDFYKLDAMRDLGIDEKFITGDASDYEKFKALFEERHVDCYILNTGHFVDKKIPKEVTLECIEAIVEERAEFKPWGNFSNLEIMEIEGFVPDMNDHEYHHLLKARITDRYDFIKSRNTFKDGYDCLPKEAYLALKNLLTELKK